jgi:hypothetical protein
VTFIGYPVGQLHEFTKHFVGDIVAANNFENQWLSGLAINLD